MGQHPFWWTMTAACMVWYSTITVYVAFKGIFDIRNMLARLASQSAETDTPEQRPPAPPNP